jgi:hypothetical protein
MRKKLLSEAQVRRFQSLASIQPLNEMDSSYKKHDDEDEAAMKDDMMEAEEEMDEALYEEEEEGMDLEKDEEDEGMGDADVELDEELVDQFMDAVKTIEQVADVLGGAGAGEEMDMGGDDMEMGGDAPLELDAGDEEDAEEDEEAMLQEALSGISYVPSQKEVVKLVAKRVAKRLQEAKRAEARLNRALGKK